MKKRLFCLVGTLVFLISLLSLAAGAAATIGQVGITATHPTAGENPDFVVWLGAEGCKVDESMNSGGYRAGVRWRTVSTGVAMGPNDTFQPNTMYELSVMLTAKSGYVFDTGSTDIQINMDPNTSWSYVQNSSDRAVVTLLVTAEGLYINRVAVNGLSAPVPGETPDYTVTPEGTAYTLTSSGYDTCKNGVTWYDATESRYLPVGTAFLPGHTYWTEIHLAAKAGYQFPLDVVGFVDGQTVNVGGAGEVVVLIVYFDPCQDHIHTPSDWRITQVYHYKVCTTCGEMLTDEDHRWSPKYHAVDETGHAYQCADCKCYDTVHPHNPGPEATETTPQTCKDCGYVIQKALGDTQTTEATENTEATQPDGQTDTGVKKHHNVENTPVEDPSQPTEESIAKSDTATQEPAGQETEDFGLVWILVILGGLLVCTAGVLVTVKVMKK